MCELEARDIYGFTSFRLKKNAAFGVDLVIYLKIIEQCRKLGQACMGSFGSKFQLQ